MNNWCVCVCVIVCVNGNVYAVIHHPWIAEILTLEQWKALVHKVFVAKQVQAP